MSRAFNIGTPPLASTQRFPSLDLFQIPARTGLVGAYSFAHGLDMAVRNWADPAAPAQQIGAPVEGANFLTLSAAGYYQTQIAETAAMSMMFIGRENNADSVGWMGNYASSAAYGVGMYTQAGAATVGVISGRDTGSGGGTVASATTGNFGIYSMIAPATGQTRIDNITAGASVLGATGNRVVSGPGPLRIGRLYHSTLYQGAHDQVCALVWSRDLDGTERAQMIGWLRAYAATLGITV